MFSISKPRNFPLKWNWPPSSFLCASKEVRSRDLAAQEVTDLLLIFLDESLAAIHVFHRLSVGAADSEEPAVVLAGHGATSESLTGAALREHKNARKETVLACPFKTHVLK